MSGREVTAYRLSAADESRMARAVFDYVQRLASEQGRTTPVARTVDVETARRLAVHSIGCADLDLRDVELKWRDALVTRLFRGDRFETIREYGWGMGA